MTTNSTLTPEHLRGQLAAHRAALRALLALAPGGLRETAPIVQELRKELGRETRISAPIRAGVEFEMAELLRPAEPDATTPIE